MKLRKKVNSLGLGLFLVGFIIIATQCLPDETLQNLGLFFIGLSMIGISLSLAVFSLVIKYGKHRNKKHRKRRTHHSIDEGDQREMTIITDLEDYGKPQDLDEPIAVSAAAPGEIVYQRYETYKKGERTRIKRKHK